MDTSYRTAIKRNKLSNPMEWLLDNSRDNWWTQTVLDYGCGWGFDCDVMGFKGYDPHFRPYGIREEFYNLIVCIYVLNVIPNKKDRDKVLQHIKSLLYEGGHAYIAVRNDKENLKGYTQTKTWQGLIKLDLPVMVRKQGFVIYRLDK